MIIRILHIFLSTLHRAGIPFSHQRLAGRQSFSLRNWIAGLVLPCLLWPLAQLLSSHHMTDGDVLVIYDMRLASLSALLVLYGIRTLPGLLLLVSYGLLCRPDGVSIDLFCQVGAALISYAGYYACTGKRSATSFGRSQLTAHRIAWLVVCNGLLYFFFSEATAALIQHTGTPEMVTRQFFSVASLISLQGVMTGCLTGIPFIYLLLRIVRRPSYFSSYMKVIIRRFPDELRPSYFALWMSVLLALMIFLVRPDVQREHTIFSTFYSQLFLLPLMLWGVMRVGHVITAPLWTIMLIILGKYSMNYIPQDKEFMLHQVLVSTSFFVFSLIIVVMGVIVRTGQIRFRQVASLGNTDPLSGLPNLRALAATLRQQPDSLLCMIQTPELDQFTRWYGLHFRLDYQKALVRHIGPLLTGSETLYAGHDLLLRLAPSGSDRLDALFQAINGFRFTYDNRLLGLCSGLGYSYVAWMTDDIYRLTGKLSIVATLSLSTGRPENLLAQMTHSLGKSVAEQSNIRTALQHALDNDGFVLMAQPIVSTRGEEDYHEILIRMKDECGQFISPDRFLPVATGAGLAPVVDLWVIKNALKTMRNARYQTGCFAINLMPATICRPGFSRNVQVLLSYYGIGSHQIIFEVTETDTLPDMAVAKENLQHLRTLGCRVAIDDFGTGYASYARLADIQADILKIDGSFIRTMLASQLNHYIVESFCHVAQMNNMQVVAEFVENADIQACLEALGVEWLQGYHIGKPVPLLTLFKALSH
jgi:EAL domain-containing protein (putative c-di-GMP-specific phosphodiesterase class I)